MSTEIRMVTLIQEYLTYKRSLGFLFRNDKDGGELLNFGRYADRIDHCGTVKTDLAVQWAKGTGHDAPIHWARRLDLVRGFARYRLQFDPNTEIPASGLLGPSRYFRRPPYIYTDQEVGMILKEASAIRPAKGLCPKTYATLFGLLACTGMRVSEALALNDDDVDLVTGLLTIRWSKFGRSRLVPVHHSTILALRHYKEYRNQYLRNSITDALFVNENGARLVYHQVRREFHSIRVKLKWTATGLTRLPRIHDLRHTFAVRCITRWYKEGQNVDQKISTLATYLGHVNVTKTYWYLTGVPELLAVVGNKFERFTHMQPKGDK